MLVIVLVGCASTLEELWVEGSILGGGFDDVPIDKTTGKDASPCEHVSRPHDFKNRYGERTGKETGYRFFDWTGIRPMVEP